MMKKSLLLLLSAIPLLAGCSSSSTYNPDFDYPGKDPKLYDMTINFFYDYSHSTEVEWVDVVNDDGTTTKVLKDVEKPFFTMRWWMLEPLGKCPEEAILTNADAKDPNYPIFLGYSEYSSAIDEDLIWNFETDYKQSNILNLYGIWVSRQEDK